MYCNDTTTTAGPTDRAEPRNHGPAPAFDFPPHSRDSKKGNVLCKPFKNRLYLRSRSTTQIVVMWLAEGPQPTRTCRTMYNMFYEVLYYTVYTLAQACLFLAFSYPQTRQKPLRVCHHHTSTLQIRRHHHLRIQINLTHQQRDALTAAQAKSLVPSSMITTGLGIIPDNTPTHCRASSSGGDTTSAMVVVHPPITHPFDFSRLPQSTVAAIPPFFPPPPPITPSATPIPLNPGSIDLRNTFVLHSLKRAHLN
jgi:hypothetical protein